MVSTPSNLVLFKLDHTKITQNIAEGLVNNPSYIIMVLALMIKRIQTRLVTVNALAYRITRYNAKTHQLITESNSAAYKQSIITSLLRPIAYYALPGLPYLLQHRQKLVTFNNPLLISSIQKFTYCDKIINCSRFFVSLESI